eukprot:CAMPEP_0206308858 /NCGR_PEP_ID=MMETSP0106_2-20121207/12079_1 /ASSEMBLY_ACC=CAM_ASM_000206 /TAXON_ID=81532 /ORGANISM="Acanthoeca-like sp., Strain 10tr" /LENGTH=732 /DNA_ID=CAMNT_0053739917 /DNA_START=132 /DNA_END=2325 /DNA_ORIENTATION=+
MSHALRTFVGLAVAVTSTQGFYLPGVAPRAYVKDELLPLLVNRLDSTESIIPYDYYHFDFCEMGETAESDADGTAHPKEGAKVSENLGQILLGERIRHSPYEIRMREDVYCRPLCQRKYNFDDKKSRHKFKLLKNAIKKDYMHHWIIDNLPAVECTSNCRGGVEYHEQPYYRLGFPVGCAIGEARKSMTICTVNTISNMYPEETFINNHVDLVIDFHESTEFTGARIVGVQVSPRSIRHKSYKEVDCGHEVDPQPFKLTKDSKKLDLVYTYSVAFRPSPLKWASRWDSYLQSAENTSIHWFSIVNSLIIVVFLSGMIGVILVKTLHKDISRYNNADESEDAQEEFGWKLVHGDVFRPPSNPMLLSVLLGTGSQIMGVVCVTLLFACLGFLSPATRGGLMTSMLVMYVFLGTPAGFVSSRMYKMFGGEQWKSNVLVTAFLVPSIIFAVFFVLNLILWAKESSAAVPFGTLVALVLMWFFISVPLTSLGAYLGVQAAGDRAAGPHQPDSAADPTAVAVHPVLAGGADGWHPAVWVHLHPALLHPELDLGPQAVLRFWVSLPSLCHPLRDGGGVDDSAVLLPPVRRELPLVVAGLPVVGVMRLLRVPVCHHLLHSSDGGGRHDQPGALHRIHLGGGAALLGDDRHDRFLWVLRVCAQDLLGRQGGLSLAPKTNKQEKMAESETRARSTVRACSHHTHPPRYTCTRAGRAKYPVETARCPGVSHVALPGRPLKNRR